MKREHNDCPPQWLMMSEYLLMRQALHQLYLLAGSPLYPKPSTSNGISY